MKKLLSLLLVVCCTTITIAQTNFKLKGDQRPTLVKKSELTGFRPKAIQLLQKSKNQKTVIKTRNYKIAADKAEIILEAHDLFETGDIGYQMLLDTNYDTYGSLFYEGLNVFYDTYERFEYKIPANADPDMFSKNVIVDGEDKVEIKAGIYDYLIVCPYPGDGIMIPHGEFSMFDDFNFEGGYTYRFLLTMEQWEYGVSDYVNIYADIDASVKKVILPVSSMDMTASETIIAVIANHGTSAISNFPISYQIDGQDAVTETCTQTIQPREKINYTFSTKADFAVEKTYRVNVYTKLKGDLVPYNDMAEGICKHLGILTLPFSYHFPSPEDFDFDWVVKDNNEDGLSWEYSSWEMSPDGSIGVAQCPTYIGNADDYLISPPLQLDRGDHFIAFYVKGILAEDEEQLEILYSKSMKTEEMTAIGNYTFKDNQFRRKAINFNVSESGVYYFAFHAKSIKGTNIILDEINIEKGSFNLSPEIIIEKAILPYSNCDLSDKTKIGMRISNKGTGKASQFKLSYQINGGPMVNQTFNEELPVEQTKDYYFDIPANLLDIGEYTITLYAEADNKTDVSDAQITHYAPITELPFVTDFYLDQKVEGYWTQMTQGTWEYDRFIGSYSTRVCGLENGLLSRCFQFAHPFRMKIAYYGGLFGTPSSFYIAYGKPGTEISTWEKIYENKNVLDVVEAEFDVQLDTPGNYSIVLVNTTSEENIPFALLQSTVSEILERDIRVSGVDSPLAVYMPSNQLNNEGVYNVSVENRGSQAMTSIKAWVNKGEEKLFSSNDAISLQSSENAIIQIKGGLKGVKIGENIDLKIEVNSDKTDLYATDNIWTLPTVHATDTVYATEQVKNFSQGTGQDGKLVKMGNLYTLNELDTLTSISIGVAQNNYYTPTDMGVAIYRMKDDGITIDRELFSTTFERGGEGRIRNIYFVPRVLPAGKYFFEVQQLTYNNIGVACENAPGSYFYQNTDGKLELIAQNGNIVVRANFGHHAKAYRKNVAVNAISLPLSSKALFSSEETITAVVENIGAESVTDIPVSCKINNHVEKTVKVSLAPYERKSVAFKPMNLSTPGEYLITISATLEEDEDLTDNTTSRTLISMEEANPYQLDFESCNDFDTGHQFNPRWWTIDRLDYEVNSWWQFDFPHSTKPVGFLAFNISSTIPPMTEELNVPGFFPHSGKRFGAAFVTSEPETESDVWLISPQLLLSTNASLELYVKTFAIQSMYSKLERYRLLVSDTDDKFESFKALADVREAPVEWTKVTADLSAYNNKKVYIALQYISKSLEGVVMMVDDIAIKSDGVDIREVYSGEPVRIWVDQNEKMLFVVAGEPIEYIELYTISGQKIHQTEVLGTENGRLRIDSYKPGVYMVHLRTTSGVETKKFILN